MTKTIRFFAFSALLLIFQLAQAQQVYYVDQVSGNDLNSGTSTAAPWKNLTKLYNLTLSPGSSILLKCGSVWTSQQLKFKGSGTAASPIIVNKYGTGATPVIHGNGLTGQGVVYLYNQQYIEINNLEITNSPNGPVNSDFFVGLYQNGNNPLGADRRGVMVVIDGYGTANHIYLKNLNVHHIKGQLGSGQTTVNGAIPKRTGGIYFTVLGSVESSSNNSRFNDILIDSCDINYCENVGLAFDNEWNVYYPGGTEYTNWYNRRFSNIKVSNNVIHHIGKNAMIIRCTDETGLIERNVCYETALGTTGNTMFTARAKNTVFQYNEGYYNRSTTQTVDPGNIDGCMYDPDFGSIGIIFQYSYSHDNSEGIYWGCNTRGANNNTTGIPDVQDTGCTLRYCISQNDKGDLVYFNYSSAGNEIYNNVFYIGSGLSPNIIHENSGNNHTYNFFNNIIYNLSSATNGADYAWGSGTGVQTRNISHNIFYGNHHVTEPADLYKIISDPKFANPGSGGIGIGTLAGYKLMAGSPAIASGRLINNNGGKDYFGNTVSASILPNRGAYEGFGTGASSPKITSFTPTTATAGTTVTITGTNLNQVNAVSFGGVVASSFNVVSSTILTAVVGSGATGKIIIGSAIGNDTSTAVFNFCTPPPLPSCNNVTICNGATASLTATGIGNISWHSASTGGQRLSNTATLTTPALYASTTYYVQDSTCAVSSRRAVTVNIYPNTGTKSTVTACTSYSWNSTSYTNSGTYTRNYYNANGCLSTDTLLLTIDTESHDAYTVSACDSFYWNGTVYKNSGQYVYAYTNLNSCYSVDTLYLTINSSKGTTSTVTACNNYQWRGTTYTTSGTYTKSTINSTGCLVVDTLSLTINYSTNTSTTIITCEPYSWNGNVYSNSGNYVNTYTNSSGCASADTLKLTVGCNYNYPLPSNIDAGFENQTTGSLASANPNTSTTQWSFVLSGNGQVRTINATGGYGGSKYLSVGKLNPTTNTSTTVNSNILSTNTFLSNTKYIVQFHYKRNTGTPDPASFVFISLDGSSAARDQSAISLGTPVDWTKYAQVVTTNTTTTPTTNGVAGINIKMVGTANGSNSAVVDVDNFVVYPADNQATPEPDVTAPGSPTALSYQRSSNTISLNWSSPAGGLDGGKYMVVRYTMNPQNESGPLQNAVYKAGSNTIGTNGTILYIGNNNSYSDASITNCSTYWYRVYAFDKAYNYSNDAATISASLSNSSSPSVSVCGSYTWNGNTYTQSGVYTYTTTNIFGCDSVVTLSLTITPCSVNFSVNLFLEGYLLSPGLMKSTLYNVGISNDPSATDSITIYLWNPSALNAPAPYFSTQAILHNNGLASIELPSGSLGNSYYIAISHRNSLGVWSSIPVNITQNTNYNFSILQNAYSNGVNQPLKALSGTGYGLFAGDVNNDGTIDLSDLQAIENQSLNSFSGYLITDCDGNLTTNISDIQIAEANAAYFLFLARP